MAEALVGGAALGALLGVLLEKIMNLVERTVHFNDVLADVKSQVESLNSAIKCLSLVSDFLDLPKNTDNLKKLINEGNELILKCEDVESNTNKLMKRPKAPFYTKKLRDFDVKLRRASEQLVFQMNVEQTKKLAAMTKYYCTNCCSIGTSENNLASRLQSKLPFQFYHDKKLKGKIGPSLGDAVLGRVVEHIKANNVSNKVKDNEGRIKEWGLNRYGKTFHRTFETLAQEKLQNWFRCDLSTTTTTTTAHNNNNHFNPPPHLPGVLYVSTAKLAFCSKKYTNAQPHATSLYLKVIIPFQLLKAVNSSDQDQHIQLISIDDQEFQFVNFRNFTGANKCLLQIPGTTPPLTCNGCGK